MSEWIVPSILPVGLVVVTGAAKSGKSQVALWLALSAAQGQTLSISHEPITTLVIDLQNGIRRIRERLAAQLDGDTAPETLHIDSTLVEHHVREFGYRFVVIDPIHKFANSPTVLRELAHRLGICVLVVNDQPGQTIEADGTIQVDRIPASGERVLTVDPGNGCVQAITLPVS